MTALPLMTWPRTAAPWQAGTDPDYLRELVTYWHDGFDWRARERELNALPQFTAGIDGQRVHFVHVRAPGSGPARLGLPLILTHGWPSSFVEMLPLAALLTDPGSHGDGPDDAFDVVIPSLPGFAFSGLPPAGPVTPPVIADLWARLMNDVLGYPRVRRLRRRRRGPPHVLPPAARRLTVYRSGTPRSAHRSTAHPLAAPAVSLAPRPARADMDASLLGLLTK